MLYGSTSHKLSASGNLVWNISDARKHTIYNFPGITHLSEDFKMLLTVGGYIKNVITPHRALGQI